MQHRTGPFWAALIGVSAACSQAAEPVARPPEASVSSLDSLVAATRRLAGGDRYLTITQNLQCHEPGPDDRPIDAAPSTPNERVPPTRIFDNLYYIGGTRTGSWLITTSEGYVMIDGMYGDSPESETIPGMKALGLDPAKVKYLLITHSGPDHAGGAKYWQEHYGTRIMMSQRDWDAILNPQPGSWVLDRRPKEQRPLQERTWVGPPRLDQVGKDGDSLTLGGLTVRIYFTPRAAEGGGLSFIAPVRDGGKSYVWATYGNTGLSRTVADQQIYRASVQRFLAEMRRAGVDAITSSHPFVDGSNLRIRELAERKPGAANPFAIGKAAAQNYIEILDQCAALVMARNAAGLDDGGIAKRTESR